VAWIDPETAVLTKITASVDKTLEDVGAQDLAFRGGVCAIPFQDLKRDYWFRRERA